MKTSSRSGGWNVKSFSILNGRTITSTVPAHSLKLYGIAKAAKINIDRNSQSELFKWIVSTHAIDCLCGVGSAKRCLFASDTFVYSTNVQLTEQINDRLTRIMGSQWIISIRIDSMSSAQKCFSLLSCEMEHKWFVKHFTGIWRFGRVNYVSASGLFVWLFIG